MQMVINEKMNAIYFEGIISDLKSVEIYNINGKKVKTIRRDFGSINMGNIPSAIYIIKIKSDKFVQTKKLIKI